MKRFFAFLLAICTMLSCVGLFSACDNSQNPPENNFTGEVTKEQWNLAVITEKFNNVTINYGFFQTEIGEVKTEILIDGDKVLKTMNDVNLVVGYTGEQAENQKSIVLDLFIGLIEKYENFTFDEQESVYVSTDTITSTVTDDVSGYTAVETLTNGKVKFNDDYTIEWLLAI